MALLKIIKLSNKTWKHNSDVDGNFILTKFYAKQEDNEFLLVETYGSKRRKYLISEIEVYDIGGSAEPFTNFDDLFLRLEALKYPAFYIDGEFTFNPESYDLSEFGNAEADKFVKESEVLSSIISTYTDATTPLAGTELALIDDGTGWKKVAVSEFQTDVSGKLDKVSTAGVERAYIINADGSQGTKATSDFKDVLEFADLAAFPVTGETGIIYVALDTNFTYRWSGSAYVQIGGGTEVDIFNPYNGNYRVGFQLFRRGLTTSTLSGVSDALAFTGGGALSASTFGSSFVKATSPSTAGAKLELNGSSLFRVVSNKFIYHFDFVVDDAVIVNSARMFVGLNNNFGTLGNVNPSTMTNCLGVGCDASETTLSIIHNDGSGTATKFNLGADFPSNSKTSYYRFKIYFDTTNSQSTIKCKLERYDLSFNLLFETEHIITTDIITTGSVYPMYWRNNESTASAVSLLIGKTLIAENV